MKAQSFVLTLVLCLFVLCFGQKFTCPKSISKICNTCYTQNSQNWCGVNCYSSHGSCSVTCPSGYNCYMDCSKTGCSSLSSINCTATPSGICQFDCSGESPFIEELLFIFFFRFKVVALLFLHH